MKFRTKFTRYLVTTIVCGLFLVSGIANAQTVNYRSIGTWGPHDVGSASVTLGSTTVTFSDLLPAEVGVGDQLILDWSETLFILSRDSHYRVTVQTPAQTTHTSVAFEIRRAHDTPALWESSRQGNLVISGFREVGVVADDETYGSVTIDGSTTDDRRYMMLTVAPRVRHNGTAAQGASIDGGRVVIRDDYTRVEGLVLLNGFFATVSIDAANVVVSHLVISGTDEAGIRAEANASNFAIRNSIIAGINSGTGILGAGGGVSGVIENCSLTGNNSGGIVEGSDVFTVTNTISLNNGGGPDFNVSAGSRNIDSDGTAPGSIATSSAVAEFVAPPNNLHLRSSSSAIDVGLDLSASFFRDIDGQRRPVGRSWDIGADEVTASNVYLRSIGNRTTTNNSVQLVNGSSIVIGNSTTWRDDNHGRGDRFTVDSTHYTVLTIESNTRLVLTRPYVGPNEPGKDYTLARKFPTLADWESCIDGSAVVLPGCHDVGSNSLVSDNRSEIGIVYDDGAPYLGVQFENSLTDARHSIQLTADGTNRHYGLIGQGVTIDNAGTQQAALEIWDDHVTVEWLKITGLQAGKHGVDVRNQIADSAVVLGNLLIYGFQGDGIQLNASVLKARIYNNNVFNCDRGILVSVADPSADINILNNTVYGNSVGGILSWSVNNPELITVRNNISHSNAPADFSFSGPVNAVSSHNLSRDATAPGTFPQHDVDNGNGLIMFVSATDLHIQSGSQAADQGADLSSVFGWDIDGTRRDTPWDIGADDVFAVTAVDLLRFEAVGYESSVLLEWETGSETNNAGFYVYRSESLEGPYELVSPSSVPGLGTSAVGTRYRYVDSDLDNGRTYYYELEDFELSGARERHGPVSATPRAGVSLPPEEPPEEPAESPSSSTSYGDPGAVSFRVLSRDRRHVVLELVTGGFYAEAQPDGTVRLEVPGLVEGEAHEGPQVPVKRSWIDAMAGRGVRVASVEAEDIEVFTGLRPMETGSSGIAVSRRGAVRAVRRRGSRRGSTEEMFPSRSAQVLSTGFQGDVKKVYVELAPLRYDGRKGELQLSRRLVVRLAFAGRVAEERSLGGSRGRMSRRRPGSRTRLPKGSVVARLGVRSSGLYGVSFEEVFGSRQRALPSRWLRLSRQGEPVAFHVDGEVFGRGRTLYFVSEGSRINPYGPEAVYELEVGVEGERMEVDAKQPTGSVTMGTYWQKVEREENLRYAATLLDEANVWIWDTILNGTSGSYPFEAMGVEAPSGESGELELRLRGVSPEGNPEFVLRMYVNEVFLDERRWSGGELNHLVVEVPSGVVVEGTNRLRLEHATDTYSGVLLDGFSCTHARASVTDSGRLTGTWSATGPASVAGAQGPVVDVTQVPPVWLSEVHRTETGVRFWAETGHRYEVSSPAGLLKPEVHRAGRIRLKRVQAGADYLLIGPHEFLVEAEPLLALRRSQGLSTRSVTLEDIYAEFGYGEVRPEAIREFLSYVYHTWNSPQLRYVVLLGDGTYDYKDYLGLGVPNVIPPLLARTSYLWTASDPAYGWVNGEDELPDIAIGRLPADTVEETRAMVGKLVAFGEGEGPTGPLVLVADDADEGGDFRASAEELASGVLWGEELRKIYLGELGVDATREAIVNAFDNGAQLMSYVGHGGTRLWANEQIFDAPMVLSLSPQSRQPIVLTINCYTGSFHLPYPDYDSLSEELVKMEDRGAVASISPSGLSMNTPAHYLHAAFLEELTSGRHEHLGDAILAAQETYATTGALPELLTIYHLFGDPATKLKGLND